MVFLHSDLRTIGVGYSGGLHSVRRELVHRTSNSGDLHVDLVFPVLRWYQNLRESETGRKSVHEYGEGICGGGEEAWVETAATTIRFTFQLRTTEVY